MQKNKFNLGGEQSGHIILGKFATTGDGLLVALRNSFFIEENKKSKWTYLINFKPTPQILENIEVKDKSVLLIPQDVKKQLRNANKIIKDKGRILVRKSGTEPKIRIMSESKDSSLNKLCVNIVKKSIK